MTASLPDSANNFVRKAAANIGKPFCCGLLIAGLLVFNITGCIQVRVPEESPRIEDTGASLATQPPAAGNIGASSASAPAFPGATTGYLKPIRFTLTATDADGDPLVYSATNLPDGASFDPETLTFSWTPRYDQAGTYSVHFEVSDGELTDAEDITITVLQPSADWDINGDGSANVLDMVLIGQRWGQSGLTGWIIEDANEDGNINILDMIIIGQNWTG